jgi:FKBP-type peptidyl-prolyl cis-trans isomerase FklB
MYKRLSVLYSFSFNFPFSLLACLIGISVSICTGCTVTKKLSSDPLLSTIHDSASYAIGYSVANIGRSQGVSKLNEALVAKAFTDVMSSKPFLIDEASSNTLMNRVMAQSMDTTDTGFVPSNIPVINSLNDSISYALSLNHASFFRQQGITSVDTFLLTLAVNDVLNNKPTLINDSLANNIMNRIMVQIQEESVKSTIEEGRIFLLNNQKRPEVITTASGLQYEIIRAGTGIKPTAVDTFVCHYRGTLLNGTEVDASYNRGEPLIMGISQVIKGWTEGLQLMPVGSKFKFYIPYTLGYGAFDNPPIPGGSMLIFEIELLDVRKAGGG